MGATTKQPKQEEQMDIQYKDKTIKINRDPDPESPRDWDNLGTMYFFHRRYNLGDKHSLSIEEAIKIETDPNYIWLPVYMYDHSGYTISTKPFSCPWDSGKLGIIAVSLAKVRKEFGIKYVTRKWREKILTYLNNEVETYDQYLTGEVYGYEVDDDSCWGFYGEEEALNEAKSIVDAREAA